MSKLHYKFLLPAVDHERAERIMRSFCSFGVHPMDSTKAADGTSFVECLEWWHYRCIAPLAVDPAVRAILINDVLIIEELMKQSGARFDRRELRASSLFKAFKAFDSERAAILSAFAV